MSHYSLRNIPTSCKDQEIDHDLILVQETCTATLSRTKRPKQQFKKWKCARNRHQDHEIDPLKPKSISRKEQHDLNQETSDWNLGVREAKRELTAIERPRKTSREATRVPPALLPSFLEGSASSGTGLSGT